jgi:CARDB
MKKLLWVLFLFSTMSGVASALDAVGFTILPDVLNAGTLLIGESKTLTLSITNNSRGSLERVDFDVSGSNVQVNDNQTRISRGDTFKLQVTITAGSSPGILNTSIIVSDYLLIEGHLLPQKREIATIPVNATFVRAVEFNPGAIDFGTLAQGSGDQRKSFTVLANTSVSLFISSSLSFLEIHPATFNLTSGTGQSVTITFPLGDKKSDGSFVVPAGVYSGKITISRTTTLNTFLAVGVVGFTANVTAAAPALPPTSKPDLVFSGPLNIPQPVLAGSQKNVTVNMIVQNIGQIGSQQCSGQVLLDQTVVATFTIPALSAGASQNLQATFGTQVIGTHAVTVKLDSPTSQVSESNEANNTASSNVSL